jgi:ABC-type glycerol-3-phosphate transport system substrate-binding protein
VKKTALLLLGTALCCFSLFARGNQAGSGSGTAGVKKDDLSKTVPLVVYATVRNTDEPDGRRTDPVSRLLEQKFNIELDLTGVTDADWATQLAALVAAQDLPDIFSSNATVSVGEALIASNSQLDLKPYLNDYAPLSMNDPDFRLMVELNSKKTTVNPEGKLFNWGMCRGSWDNGTWPTVGNYILWDVYANLGYPKLDNFETDLVNVLEQMVRASPTSLSGNKTYATGAWFGDGQGYGEWMIHFTQTWPENISRVGGLVVALDGTDSTMVNMNQLTNINSSYWKVMAFYNKLWQKGLFDPDSFTQTESMYRSKVLDGRYMYVVPGWRATGANQEFTTAGSPHTFVSLPSFNKRTEGRLQTMVTGERQYAISSKTNYPERAVALLDYLSTYEFSRIAVNGPEGILWNMVNGKPVPTEEYLNNPTMDREYYLRTGARIYHHFLGYGGGTVDPATGVSIDLSAYSSQAMIKNMNAAIKDFCAYYGKETLQDVYQSATPIIRNNNILQFDSVPDDILTNITGIEAYHVKAFPKVLMARDDAEFARFRDEMIAGMAPYNPDSIFQWYYRQAQAQAEEVKATLGGN